MLLPNAVKRKDMYKSFIWPVKQRKRDGKREKMEHFRMAAIVVHHIARYFEWVLKVYWRCMDHGQWARSLIKRLAITNIAIAIAITTKTHTHTHAQQYSQSNNNHIYTNDALCFARDMVKVPSNTNITLARDPKHILIDFMLTRSRRPEKRFRN